MCRSRQFEPAIRLRCGCNIAFICRKPKPGLIFAARDRYDIDLSRAVMVGDSVKDILAGQAAGCGRTVLVSSPPPQSETSLLCTDR